MRLQNKRDLLIQIIKAEMDYDRLTDLLADEYMQKVAYDLKDSIDDAERG